MWAKKKQSGFTIVELLIVIVVIGILAAISLVAYNGIQARARASAASSALSQATKKIKVWQVDNPGLSPGDLATAGVANTSDVTYQYTAGTSGAYCITATVGTTSYKITEASQPTSGGCSGHGQGGVAAVTNYTRDPDAIASTGNFGSMGGGPAASTVSIASDQFHNGTTSFKRSITGSGASGTAVRAVTQNFQLNVGETMAWSFWVYSTRAGSISPYFEGSRVSDGAYAGCSGSPSPVSIPANTWQKVAATCSPVSNMIITGGGGYNLQVQTGDFVWFDEFMTTKSTTQYAYGDGNSTDWVWNGAANNSTSTGPSS